MSLDKAIGQLETLVKEIKRVSRIDDKSSLGSALALRDEARLISDAKSGFNVVVFGDLDDFKQLNDEHTHEAGNIAISSVGETLNRIVGKDLGARAFRISGDEFVILLEGDSVERFLSSISSFGDIPFSHGKKELTTSMSLGHVRSDGKTSFDTLLERAEIACQHAKAKRSGSCVEWTDDFKKNPLVRLNGRCAKCGARITCNVPALNAPPKLKLCPCCGESLQDG